MARTQIGGENIKLMPFDEEGRGLTVASFPVDSSATDPFGRQRVSETGQRVDVLFTYDKQPLLFDEVTVGTGAGTHDANLRAVYLSTGGNASGARAMLRQKYYNPYAPVNGQYIAQTGCLNPDNVNFVNAKAEFGYGDDSNAVGFRYTSTGASVFIRSSISGSPVDLANVAQANWDDPSADVDWTKSQIFLIDFQSLGVGRVRFYLGRGGELKKVHEINNDNIRVGPYWQLASLPLYWGVENTGTATQTARALAICAAVKSEGGQDIGDLSGIPFSVSRPALVTASSTLIPVISIQLQPTFKGIPNRMLVVPETITGYSEAQPAEFRVVVNGTLSGASFGTADVNSGTFVDTSATAITGGRTISTFYIGAGQNGGMYSRMIAGKIPLSVAGTAGTTGDVLSVCAIRASTVNASVKAAIDWSEVR